MACNRSRRFWFRGLIWTTFLGLVVAPATQAEEMTAAYSRLKADVEFLADDEQEGRAPGTEGIERAAEYIARSFEAAGLIPAPGAEGYFQPFEISGPTRLGSPQELAVALPEEETLKPRLRRDFIPLSIGGGATLEDLPVVFAGYGITAKDEDSGLDYDDYEELDVEGKAVLVLRRAPGYDQETGPFASEGRQPSQYATFQHKATNAFRHGAKAVLMVNDLAGLGDDEDELLLFTSAGMERLTTIPYLHLKRAFADKLLAAAGAPSLKELEAAITEGETFKPQSQPLDGVTIGATITIEKEEITAKNVIGVLEGVGATADETIVVGAHYDHLGKGGMGSLAPFSRDIHNGADDNASGTAMMMEMARRLSARPDPLPRRVVFIAFSGEERGLLGSRHYVNNHPLYPLNKTVAMINFDMVGRLNDKQELTVFGVESTPGLKDLVLALGQSYGFDLRANAQVASNSDHAPFHDRGIPVAFLFTGTHRDYHRPSDTADKINYDGMARIADYAELLLLDFARRPQRPEFTKTAAAEQEPRQVSGVSVSLGTIPDYDESIQGVRLNGVREDSPAEKAGLQAGDIIIGFGGEPVGTIYDFMEGMARFKPGDEVEIQVQRDGEDVTLKATLGAAERRADHGDE